MLDIEPLNLTYSDENVQKTIANALSQFYNKLSSKLEKLDVHKVLERKNPYLYRAKGINNAAQIVEGILAAYVSSSEETIFGNVFFEQLAIAVSGGQTTNSKGVDITVDKDNTIYAIAVKSGTTVFNADSRRQQVQHFLSVENQVQETQKTYVHVVGYGYGKKHAKPARDKIYRELAGQDFWTWLTGDADFYLRIIKYMGTRPDEYAKEFEDTYNCTLNRMVRDFTINYCFPDGSINWDKLVEFNSASNP